MISSPDFKTQNELHRVLEEVLSSTCAPELWAWFAQGAARLFKTEQPRDLYMIYTLSGQKFDGSILKFPEISSPEGKYLARKKITNREAARVYLLNRVLCSEVEALKDGVKKLIEVADKEELVTFLKYLAMLPHPEQFLYTAVEALRTNIVDIFDAIALNNPYPKLYFNQQQWNQMYLKAAFMQRPLIEIMGVAERANTELSRIISDYAHERWAASREVDPRIWKPLGYSPVQGMETDLARLLESDSKEEVIAAILVCLQTGFPAFRKLASDHTDLLELAEQRTLNWNNLNN